eukprot:TRINITY_DN173_c0_g1_i11.p1 TRINITY_DN173_c0_g1~~TRINITY_DN173_c0_g1_i11.p1  ORF type:complete len:180 (-),score=26.06 TRINITY_DN173_c0_g1_i11:129-668(-)
MPSAALRLVRILCSVPVWEGHLCKWVVPERAKAKLCIPVLTSPQNLLADVAGVYKLKDCSVPVCVHFLKGVCARERCPYAHVAVSPSAPQCSDFARGYCSRGASCKHRHTTLCIDYITTGRCSTGAACPFRHPLRKSRGGTARISPPRVLSRSASADVIVISEDDDLSLRPRFENVVRG